MNFLHILRKFGFIFSVSGLTVCSILASSSAHFQELGQSYISVYLPAPFKYAHKYNSIVQDQEGFMYIGSDKGVLRFDGTIWKHIPSNTDVTVLFSDSSVYTSGNTNIATIKRGPYGDLFYQSLEAIDGIKGTIMCVVHAKKGIYMLSTQGLYHWNGLPEKINLSFLPEAIFPDGESIIMYSRSRGLMRLEENEAAQWIPSYDITLGEITTIQRSGDRWILIDGRENDVSVLSQGVITRGFGNIDGILKEDQFSCIQELSDGCFAWGTKHEGVIITDNNGQALFSIDQDDGLFDNNVNELYSDASENLWVLHDHAVSRIEIPSSFTYFYNKRGLEGNIRDLVRFNGEMYAASNMGLYRLENYPPGKAGLPGKSRLIRIDGIPDDCRKVISTGDKLFVATSEGLFEFDGLIPRQIFHNDVTTMCMVGKKNSLIAASGKEIIFFSGTNLTEPVSLSGPDASILSILQDGVGYIWLTSNSGEIFVSKEEFNSERTTEFNRINTDQFSTGPSAFLKLFLKSGEIRIACNGIYYWDKESGKLLKDNAINLEGIEENICINELNEGPGKNLWISTMDPESGRNEVFVSQQVGEGYRPWQSLQFRRINQNVINCIYPENDNITWIGSNRGLIRYVLDASKKDVPQFFTHISEVILANDSILTYDFIRSESFRDDYKKGMVRLSNSSNQIHFRFRSTDYNDSRPMFQFRVSGIQEKWSEWSENSYAGFSGLPKGKYTFEVRSQDNFGSVSASDSFRFRIMPPYYGSVLAFFIYSLLIIFIIYAFQKWKAFQHVRERYKLEKIIEERTAALLEEKEKTDNLIANILPKTTADELKSKGKATSSKFKMVTVLFADIQGFTKIAEQMNPDKLIDELDRFYFKFDSVVEKYNIEKIKTIGDAYMAAGGIPIKNRTNPVEVVLAALEMQHFMHELKKTKTDIWDLRIGTHTGSVIAGVVGQKKFSYDIWGDSVNTASRMESSGEVGKVNISATTYELIKDFFDCEYRGKMPVKYKGDIEMYFVNGLKQEYAKEDKHSPNEQFLTQIQLIRLLDLEEYVFQRLDSELPEDLFFHSTQHTAHVYTQVELLGRGEKVTEEDLLMLRTAALLHDIGYIDKFDGHEERSAELAKEILPLYSYSDDQIEIICNLILATKLPPAPDDHLKKIMVDANLDHLGRVDFIIQSDKLYQEYRMHNKIKSKKDWNNYQIEFLNNFEFYTDIANKLCEVSKEQQIENIKQFS